MVDLIYSWTDWTDAMKCNLLVVEFEEENSILRIGMLFGSFDRA